jgi:hypothetical protein
MRRAELALPLAGEGVIPVPYPTHHHLGSVVEGTVDELGYEGIAGTLGGTDKGHGVEKFEKCVFASLF